MQRSLSGQIIQKQSRKALTGRNLCFIAPQNKEKLMKSGDTGKGCVNLFGKILKEGICKWVGKSGILHGILEAVL